MKNCVFKLYFPSGKTFLSHPFDDLNFPDCFSVFGSKILFTVDTTVTVANYSSEGRAYEVLDAIINAYNAHFSFTLPSE